MKANPRTRDDAIRGIDPSPRAVFRALSNENRQYILEYLVHRLGAVAVSDLATYIALKKGEPTPEGTEMALLGLYHVHLPHLTAAGLISYDAIQDTVGLKVNADDIRPFLQLTLATILPRSPEKSV